MTKGEKMFQMFENKSSILMLKKMPCHDTRWRCLTKESAKATLYVFVWWKPRGRRAGTQCIAESTQRERKTSRGQDGRSLGFGKLSERGDDGIKGAQNGYKCVLHACCVNYIPHYPETSLRQERAYILVDVEQPTKARPQNKNQPTFFFSMHSTMEKFLDDVCKQLPPEQPSCSGCSIFRWEHTWTACQPHPGVCRWKTSRQVWLPVTGRWCSATQHKHLQMHAARWISCTMWRVNWIKDRLAVKW